MRGMADFGLGVEMAESERPVVVVVVIGSGRVVVIKREMGSARGFVFVEGEKGGGSWYR